MPIIARPSTQHLAIKRSLVLDEHPWDSGGNVLRKLTARLRAGENELNSAE